MPIPRTMEELLDSFAERIRLLERRGTGRGSGSTVAAGTVMAFAGTDAPTGWLKCDGGNYFRASYPALFAAIGTSYGAVNGESFNVPNLKGRVPVGGDALQPEFDALGKLGGAKTHTLTIAEMPAHSHQWTAAGTNSPGSIPANWDDIVAANAFNLGIGPAAPETGNAIQPRGGGGAHNNLQPYAVVNYIIATGS